MAEEILILSFEKKYEKMSLATSSKQISRKLTQNFYVFYPQQVTHHIIKHL